LHTPVVVATVQSLTPEATQDLLAANATPILTVLIDEAHHAVPGSAYERVLASIEQAGGAQPVAIIGLTATPYRNDERSMLALLPICAFARTIPEMVQEGYLAPLTWKPVQVDLDLAQVATTREAGERDYAETTLAGHLLREAITARAFWFTRATAKACHTVTARLPRDGRKNGASGKPHWEHGANPSRRGHLH